MIENVGQNENKFFPGGSLKEVVANEFQDFFYLAPHRKEFFLMAGYSVLLLGAIMIADFQNFFDTPGSRIFWALLELGFYFVISDFLKRKQILAPRLQFLIDCIFYSSLMLQVIILTGGYASPVAFTLLFLTCVSAPLYASLWDTIIFVTIVALIYGFLEVIQYHSFTTIFYFHLLEGLSLVVAAVTVKISLDAFEKKAAEHRLANEKLALLNQQIGQYNEKLEVAVNEKTKELREALVNMQEGEKELKKQKTAILNILEDMEEERARTLLEKEKLSRILQSIGDAVFVVDQDKKIIIFNHVAEKISGYISGEVVGKKYDKVIKFVYEKDRKPNRTVDEVFVTKHIMEITGHTVLITKEGLDVPVADSAAPILNPNGEIAGCIVVFRDVTRDREIDRQKTEFVSVASHQLRTPLTSIKWFLEMLIDGDMGKLTGEQIETLKQIFESNERMIDLVNKLLNVSRIESGRVRVEPKLTDMNELIKSIQAEMAPLSAVKKLNLEIKLPKLPEIKIDPKLIREVIMNFLSNAIKYTPDSGSVTLAAEKGETDIVFSVKDSGIGIPVEQQNRVFHKFFRADNAVAAETEGTGMGLYVAKSIIELSGGRVWFESRRNKGSIFFFTLPLAGSQKVEGEKGLI
jgi:PAS domain S-box-containing protein